MKAENLFFQFLRLKIATIAVLGLAIIEAFVVLYLLAETRLFCNFQLYYQELVIPVTAGLQIGVQLFAGSITDRLAFYNHIVLRVLGVCGTLLDMAMFVFAKESEYLLLVIFSLRSMIIVQLNYTLFKILKLRVESVLKYPSDQQFNIFSHFVMFSQVVAYIITTVGCFVIPSIYIHFMDGSYSNIKYILTIVMIGLNLMGTTVSFFIPQSYYVTQEMLDGKFEIVTEKDIEIISKINNNNNEEEEGNFEDSENKNTNSSNNQEDSDVDVKLEIVNSNKSENIPLHHSSENLYDEEQKKADKYSSICGYLFYGCIEYWSLPVLWGVMIKYCFFAVSGSLLKIVLIFQLSNENETNDFPTPNNMCNGFFTNYIGMRDRKMR
jgi:hypothetical protein